MEDIQICVLISISAVTLLCLCLVANVLVPKYKYTKYSIPKQLNSLCPHFSWVEVDPILHFTEDMKLPHEFTTEQYSLFLAG